MELLDALLWGGDGNLQILVGNQEFSGESPAVDDVMIPQDSVDGCKFLSSLECSRREVLEKGYSRIGCW